MAVHVNVNEVDKVIGPTVQSMRDREARLLLTARRRRLARLRRRAETAAWVVGSLALAGLAFAGLAGLR
jgi:hypothetical protein